MGEEKIVVLITVKDTAEADKVANGLLEKKLAACVNVVGNVKSSFWWQDKIDEAQEVLLIAKTLRSVFGELVQTVKELHSYEVPEVIALPIIDGHEEYLQWINTSVTT